MDDDAVMPKPVKAPTEDDFEAWLDEAQAWAKTVGYVETDVEDVVKRVRGKAAHENRH